MLELVDNKWNNVKTYYTNWLQHSSSAPLEALQVLYDGDLRVADSLDERTDRQGKLHCVSSIESHPASDRFVLTLSSRHVGWPAAVIICQHPTAFSRALGIDNLERLLGSLINLYTSSLRALTYSRHTWSGRPPGVG